MHRDLFNTLPQEVLMLIFSHCSTRRFLDLVSTSKELYNKCSNEWRYWYPRIHKDYQIPTSLVQMQDGAAWRKLYKRLKTDSKTFVWGSDEERHRPGLFSQSRSGRPGKICYPHEVSSFGHVGSSIIDIQCGDASTSVLTRDGKLHVAGSLCTKPYEGVLRSNYLQQLQYPRMQKDTVIKQYSHEDECILGLSEAGDIWFWNNAANPALRIKFLHHNTSTDGKSLISKVVVSRFKSAALIRGTGIIVWPTVLEDEETLMADAVLIMKTAVLSSQMFASTGLPDDEMCDFILLQHLIIWMTSSGQVFATTAIGAREYTYPQFGATLSIEIPDKKRATSIQGCLRIFAILTENNEVLILLEKDVLELFTAEAESESIPWSSLFIRLPALQQTNVVSMAFGDWHFHALHAGGYITSYGHNDRRGELGLTDGTEDARKIRCLFSGRLIPAQVYNQGRRVWFEDIKREWLAYLLKGGVDPSEARERMDMSLGQDLRFEPAIAVSDWIEQESRDWEAKYEVPGWSSIDLTSHYAWKIAAGTTHSAALVVVDEDLKAALNNAVLKPSSSESSTKQYKWEDDHFPRLKLRDGTNMPGDCELNEWRYGCPQDYPGSVYMWI